MNQHWRVEFLLMQPVNQPQHRDAWMQLAAEWMVSGHYEGVNASA